MNSLPLFGLSVLMSFVAFGIVTRTYIWPRLRMARREEALIALTVPHTFRFIGLSFLIPGVGSHSARQLYRARRLAAENPILGTWKLQSLVYEVSATGQRSSPFGDHPDGYLSYSGDGRMYAIGVVEDRPKPRDLVPTDEEKVELQGSMFAYAGTYIADGEKVVHY